MTLTRTPLNILIVSIEDIEFGNQVGWEIENLLKDSTTAAICRDNIPEDSTSPGVGQVPFEKTFGFHFNGAVFLNLPKSPGDPGFNSVAQFCQLFTSANRDCRINYHYRAEVPHRLQNIRLGGYKNLEFKSSTEISAIAQDLVDRFQS